jgi:hypothetical protein
MAKIGEDRVMGVCVCWCQYLGKEGCQEDVNMKMKVKMNAFYSIGMSMLRLMCAYKKVARSKSSMRTT